MAENLIFIIVSFFVAIIATLAGFGSSTLLVPVAIIFMDVKTAVFLVACFHFFNNTFKIRMFWNKIDFRTFLLFGIPSIISAFLGAMLISVIPVDMVKRILALFLVFVSAFSLASPKFAVKGTRFNAALGGGLSGLLAGLLGLGGAIRSSFLIAFNLPKEAYVATSAMIAFVIDITRIPTYLITKIVQDSSYYILLPFLLVSAYAGVKIGKLLLKKINQETFRKIVLIAVLLAGLKLFF